MYQTVIFNICTVFMRQGSCLLPSASNLCARVLHAVSIVMRATRIIFSLIIFCYCSAGHCSLQCCVHEYSQDSSHLLVLWKFKVPDKLHSASYLIGLVNLRPEFQDKLYLAYIVGDLMMQQQILYFLCDSIKCTFLLRIKNEKVKYLCYSVMCG